MAATAPANSKALPRPQSPETSQGGCPGREGAGNQVVFLSAAGLLSLERCVGPGVYTERGGLVAMSKCLQSCCGEIDYPALHPSEGRSYSCK